jgi:hypothetical protein
MTDLRRFNEAGLLAFQAFLDAVPSGAETDQLDQISADPAYTEVVEPFVTVERRNFDSRLELARYLDGQFDTAQLRPPPSDGGLWSWLACFYFLEICPKSRDGRLVPGASARWISRSSDWRRYYRHLVAGPFGIYRAHRDYPERALSLLCQHPGRPGELVEQLASRQQVVTNSAIVGTATRIFVDPATGRLRRNSSGKGKGSPRRFVAILDQFDVTWDLSSLTAPELDNMLPAEFKQA